MRIHVAILTFAATVVCFAGQPDDLKLPDGFHATVVAEGLGQIRHLTVRDNGDIYVSTPKDKDGKGGGIIALRLDASHKADQIEHFGSVDGGSGIRFSNGALYAASPDGVYRFAFSGKALVPTKEPEAIVEGTPADHPGFNRANRPITLDGKGNLYIALEGSANACDDPATAKGAALVGLKPCPDLGKRAGIWRFSAKKTGQKFPSDGEQMATGIRDLSALDWSTADGNLYGIMHGRDNLHASWPNIVSAEDDDHIADELHRVTKGTDFGWPYTYFDGVKNVRLIAPDYGGDGKSSAAPGTYSNPVLTFHSRRPAPVDLAFYNGSQFPAIYRGGAFIALHGTRGQSGYDVVFVPFNKSGKAGDPVVFADGFAAFDAAKTPPVARYRPIGLAVGQDGSLYIADSQKGRIWRIAYGAN